MTNIFDSSFGKYACVGDAISATVDGIDLVARIEYDEDHGEPWKECRNYGPVSEWTSRDKAPGERVLNSHRGSYRYYDYAEAIKIAKRDGWDTEPYGTGTVGERAARAVEADFQRLKAWCNDEWYYVGVAVSVSRNGVMLDKYAASLWGIESDSGDYLTEVANELANEALGVGKVKLAELCDCED